jgi:hypothetical protein
MNANVIKSYLVQLGYDIDQPTLNKFNEAMRVTAQQVTKFTEGMATSFVEAGAAVVGTLTGIAVGTVAMMAETAKADLGFQLLARRMFMSVDAAKQYKIALDALGMSAEDVIWGPPELRERYAKLIADQRELQRGLGGDFEGQMRKIRDVEFEFTRLKVEAQYFVMALTRSLSIALTGDENGLLERLRSWNTWLIQNIPVLAGQFTQYLVPVLRDVKAIWMDIGDILRIATSEFLKLIGVLSNDSTLKSGAVNIETIGRALDHISSATRKVFDEMDKIARFIDSHPWALRLFGTVAGAIAGAGAGGIATIFQGGVGAIPGAVIGGTVGGLMANDIANARGGGASSGTDIRQMITDAARRYGVDPALALAIADRESGMNPNAPRGASGEYGMMQVMPQTFAAFGSGDPNNVQNNLNASMAYLSALSKQYHGNERLMAEHYNGSGPAARAYADDVMQRAQGGYNVGGIQVHVYVQGSNASAEEIANKVGRTIDERQEAAAKRQLVQANGPYS